MSYQRPQKITLAKINGLSRSCLEIGNCEVTKASKTGSSEQEAPARCGTSRPGLLRSGGPLDEAPDLTSGGTSSLAGPLTLLRSRCSKKKAHPQPPRRAQSLIVLDGGTSGSGEKRPRRSRCQTTRSVLGTGHISNLSNSFSERFSSDDSNLQSSKSR